jgi:protein involved in polysaccharide export with SLBB domain
MNSRFIVLFLVFLLTAGIAVSQEVKQQAEAQLEKMTPEQIDAKIKQLGMTRAEAEAKAKEYGINLETYLAKAGSSASSKLKEPTLAQPSVKVEVNQAAPAGAAVPPAQAPGVSLPSTENTAPGAPLPTAAGPVESQVKVVPVKSNEPAAKPGEIEPFGYSLFKATGMFEARPSIDNDYRIGVGDVLKIAIWGEMQSYNEYTVDSEGRILVSAVGPILVSGLTLERARKNVLNAMSSAFGGLAKSPPSIFMDLTVARIRPVRVFIMGEVGNPGGYEVSGFSNVFNSLFTVGGPKLSGSLRDIRLVRSGKTVAHVDMYDYLIGSTKTSDIRVNDNDVIYIPLRGKTVTIRGEVSRPARFELLPDEQLKRLLEFSGGIRTTMYLERVLVDRIITFAERVKDGPERKFVDVDFRQIVENGKDFQLEDGDIVTVYPILDQKKNYVTIDGSVWRPGTYQKEKLSRLKDLLSISGNPRPEAYLKRADIIRTYPDERREAINVDLELALGGDPAHNIELQAEDSVRIYSQYEMNAKRSVKIGGHVKNAGTYPHADKMTLRDLLFTAGGLEDSLFRSQTFLDRGTLMRLNPDLRTRRSIYFNPGEIFDKKLGDFPLESDDEVRVFSRSEMREGRDPVEVTGAAKRPGAYPWTTNLALYDLVFDAVGLTDSLYRKNVLLETADLIRRNDDGYTTRIVPFNLGKLYFDHIGDTLLLPGDRLVIYPRTAIEERGRNVDIFGSVKKPGRYALSENMTLIDLLLQAGGYTEDAYDVQAEIARVTRTGLGKDSLVHTRYAQLPDLFDVNAITSQQLEAMRLKSFPLQNRDQIFVRPNPAFVYHQYVTIEGEVQFPGQYALNVINERIAHLIARAGGVKPNGYLRGGRLVRAGAPIHTNIENAVEDDEGPEDIILKPGDVISIPKTIGTVTVVGNVNNPGTFGYATNRSFTYYIKAAGEEKDSSDYAVVTYPEGFAERVNFGWLRSSPTIPDGSTIVVYRVPPPLPEPTTTDKATTTFDFVKDMLAVVVSAVTVIVLATKL